MTINQKYLVLIVALGVLFFFPFLGNVHLFDWDEINFAESAREMLVTQDFFRVQINYEPFWEKPPLFFWLQALSMEIFGINEFAARFPNALAGVITLWLLYTLGKKLYSPKFGLIWSLLYFGSFLPHLYFKSGIIDPIFNLFIFIAVYFLAKNVQVKQIKWSFWGGFFAGLAIITKGPVAVLLIILSYIVYLIYTRFKDKLRIKDIIVFALTAFLVTSLWFGYEVINNGPWFIIEFIKYQIELFTQPVAGHEQPFYYHFLVVLLGCFPMSVLALKAFQKNSISDQNQSYFTLWMKILFWVVMILFTIVKTKIVHYSSMAYLPLSYLAALYVYHLIKEKQDLPKFIKIFFVIIGSVFSLLLIATPILFYQKKWLEQLLVKDPFAVACLNYDLNFTGFEFLIGIFYPLGILMALYFIKQKDYQKMVFSLALAAGITLMGYAIFVVPKIERFSQGPAILFLKSIQNKEAYVTTVGHKSYAHYYYGQVKPPKSTDKISDIRKNYVSTLADKNDFNVITLNALVDNWLMTEAIDKPAYFITKINQRENIKANFPQLNFIKNEGGFDFYSKEKTIIP
jgi:4-amino-4-deoxy-L-arabinose transferase-like glycosyltransferase